MASVSKKRSLIDSKNEFDEVALGIYDGEHVPTGNTLFISYLPVFSFANSFLGLIQRYHADDARSGNTYTQLSNTKIIDVISTRVYSFDQYSSYLNNAQMNDEDYSLIADTNPIMFLTDILGNPLPFLKEEKKLEERTLKVFTGKVPMSIGKVLLAINNHREFWDLDTDTLVDSETTMENLIKIAVLQPDQFDELFTVEIDRPESPLMRKFMEKLAILVNQQLGENLEGIDNISELEMKAYSFAGYQGKNLETVVSESKDYFRYFRYLLTKGEKIVVNEWQKDYFNSLSSMCKNYQILKKKRMNYEVSEMISYSTICFYKEKVPNFHLTKNTLEMDYFTFVEDIRNTSEELENSNLVLRIALIDELILKEYLGTTKNGIDRKNSIFVCDRNLNYSKFTVKNTTILKWKKLLEKKLSLVDFILSHGKTKIPVGIANDCIL